MTTEIAQCVSCLQWRLIERMVTVKPQDGLAYACNPCHLAMQRPN